MSRPEDRDAMMAPQDPSAENKGRSTRDPVNWTVHGGNLQAVGGRASKKRPTDAPPNDLMGGTLPTTQAKLPPTIVTHNDAGLTTGSHSADDERFSNQEAVDLKERGESSINDATPIVANKNEENANNQETDEAKAQASLDAMKSKESDAERAEREEMERLELLTKPEGSAPVNQSANTTIETPASKPDPVLTTR
jgi:hypothetical protein